ncbi:MAG TPA: MBL fold metallo-hydrolase [Halanaerobiales bacterium]|nr:MBL fold metallo-hydrolase [Halanaerobiales bacterium]
MFMHEKESHVEKIDQFKVNKNEFILNWLGQAGYLIKTPDNALICIDPYYSNSVERYDGRPSRRMWYNRFLIENFHPDLVLCSHDHLDHTDPETLPLIFAFSDAVFYGPESSHQHMKKMQISEDRLQMLELEQEYSFRDIKIKTTFAEHTEDSLGFIFEINNIKLYFTGDTSLNERLFKYKEEDIDIMISCINGKYGNLDVEEAGILARELGVKLLIPMHYGLVTDNTVDVNAFIEHFEKETTDYLVMGVEENYYISKKDNQIITRNN